MSSYRRYITENSSKEARITLVIPVATRYLPASRRRMQSEYDEKSRILDAIVAPKHRNTAPIKRATLLRVAPPRLSYLFLHLIFLHLVFVSLLVHRVFLRFMVASFGRVSSGHVLAVFRLAIPGVAFFVVLHGGGLYRAYFVWVLTGIPFKVGFDCDESWSCFRRSLVSYTIEHKNYPKKEAFWIPEGQSLVGGDSALVECSPFRFNSVHHSMEEGLKEQEC